MNISAQLSQQQLLSPQMQQGLQLLQATAIELRQLLSQELIANPILEERVVTTSERELLPTTQEEERWRDESPAAESTANYSFEAEERRRYFLESQHSTETLAEALSAQSAGFPKNEQPLIESIIGNLDTDGYLRISSEELASELGTTVCKVEAVVAKIQQLDPPGVAARNLQESLLLQLERKGKENSLASRIVKHYLKELGLHQYEKIATALYLPLESVLEAQKVIATLEPHPGRAYGPIDHQEVIPDVIVTADGEDFIVRLHEEALPHIQLNDHYKEILSTEVDNRELQSYLRDKIRQGRQFLSNLDQRQQTLLTVSREIVRRQQRFFQQGELIPLTMAEVAEPLGLHPTTVGRAVSGKYMETPRGLFSWKYFFTSGLQQEDGTTLSSNSVKQAIQQLIEHEEREHPLSDQEIVDQLEAQGISVARRTIANYRDQLKILPKSLRKRANH
jgi:RNA polymerase sigma-54 factor